MAKPNIIKVSCWQLGRPIKGLLSDNHNHIEIERDVLPIVFVPGIMGRRLKAGEDVVWDPDDPKFRDQEETWYQWLSRLMYVAPPCLHRG